MARPGEKSVAPGVELEPEEMDALVQKDLQGWYRRAKALHDVAVEALKPATPRIRCSYSRSGITLRWRAKTVTCSTGIRTRSRPRAMAIPRPRRRLRRSPSQTISQVGHPNKGTG